MEFHSVREKKQHTVSVQYNLRRHSTNKICPARPVKHVVLAMDQKNAKHAKNYHTRLTRDVRKFANYIYQKWYRNPIHCKNYFQNYPLFDFLRNIEQDFFFFAPLLRSSWRWWQSWKWRRTCASHIHKTGKLVNQSKNNTKQQKPPPPKKTNKQSTNEHTGNHNDGETVKQKWLWVSEVNPGSQNNPEQIVPLNTHMQCSLRVSCFKALCLGIGMETSFRLLLVALLSMCVRFFS